MIIKIEFNFKLKKLSVTIKKTTTRHKQLPNVTENQAPNSVGSLYKKYHRKRKKSRGGERDDDRTGKKTSEYVKERGFRMA